MAAGDVLLTGGMFLFSGTIRTVAVNAVAYFRGVNGADRGVGGVGFSVDRGVGGVASGVDRGGEASGCEETTTFPDVSYGLLLKTCFPKESWAVRARHFFW